MKTITPFLLAVFLVLISCKETTTASAEKFAAEKTLIDLTHPFSEETVYWVTAREFTMDTVFEGQTEMGHYYSAYNFTTAEHGGTHLDAPIHFAANKQSVDEISLTQLIGLGIKINVSSKTLDNPDYLISIQDFKDWERIEGIEIPRNSIVLLQTGFADFYPDREKYMGTAERGEAALKDLHFPGLAPEAASWLVENRNVKAVGIDTPSIDYGQSETFRSHVILLEQNIPAFENLADLSALPSKDFEVIALPMKIKGGSGAPLRIIARF